jgi:translation initiation factor 1
MKTTRDPNSRLVYSTDGEKESPRDSHPPRQKDEGVGSRRLGIRIRLERRASDRLVTVVTGLPGSDKETVALARALKSACGTGGTVKDGVLELQGDHRDAVEAALAGRGLKSKRAGG